MGALQSLLSAVAAFAYILLRKKTEESVWSAVGLEANSTIPTKTNGSANRHVKTREKEKSSDVSAYPSPSPSPIPRSRSSRTTLLKSYFTCALLATFAAPFGFASLSHISYPAMVLGKSCKLVPVLLMNVLLYRRKFKAYKYVVVALVTAGITIFMVTGEQKGSKYGRQKANGGGGWSSVIGMTYLLINLAMDGVLNSTQDEIFSRHRVTGQQMMLFMSLSSFLLNVSLSALPLPYIPVLHPSHGGTSDLRDALQFLTRHPRARVALIQFAVTGALGQLFIFETLQHFGSLTLV